MKRTSAIYLGAVKLMSECMGAAGSAGGACSTTCRDCAVSQEHGLCKRFADRHAIPCALQTCWLLAMSVDLMAPAAEGIVGPRHSESVLCLCMWHAVPCMWHIHRACNTCSLQGRSCPSLAADIFMGIIAAVTFCLAIGQDALSIFNHTWIWLLLPACAPARCKYGHTGM